MHMTQAKPDSCWKSLTVLVWLQRKKMVGADLFRCRTWRSCPLSPCWLEPSDCQVSWPSVGGSRDGHRFFLSLSTLLGSPSHTDFEPEHAICLTQDQTHRKLQLEKCLCTGASPLLLYLEPRDHHACMGMSDHVEEKQDNQSTRQRLQTHEWAPKEISSV